jgi:PAS domain S-box-containing protein
MLAIVFFWQTVKRKADSRWRFAAILVVLFAISVGLSIYETAFPVDAVIDVAGTHFSYLVIKALLENIGLFSIVSLLLLLLTVRLHFARREVRLLAQVASSSADAIVTVSASGAIASWNHGAEMVLGHYADEMIGSTLERIVPADCLPQLRDAVERCRREGFVKGLSFQMLAKGRKPITCAVTLSLVSDDDGNPVGVSLFIRDVTEQKKLEEELLQSSKMSAMGTMAAGIVHEFGNLLTVISGRAQLGRTARTVDEARAAFDAVAACAARAKSVTNNLLAYAKRQQPNKSLGQLSDSIDAALALLDKELQRAGITVKRQYESVPDTSFDREQMTQVFINLLINASNAMRNGGGSIQISVSQKSSYIEAEVRDSGPGIPPEVMPNLFEPFSTVGGEANGRPRTGLGLFVCREIVKFHSGSISVESAKDRGTAFRVYLPVTADLDSANPSDTHILERGKCRVAVIDHDSMIRDLLAEAFRRKGMKAAAFQDAAAAEAAHVDKSFDLVFVDAATRDSGGARYIERLKAADGPFVIAMVGEAVDAEEFRRIERGTMRILRKPFGLEQVTAICDLVVIPVARPAERPGPPSPDASSPGAAKGPARPSGQSSVEGPGPALADGRPGDNKAA